MNKQFKHRLIGGLVILAIAALCLPLLFHETHPEVTPNISRTVPVPPAMQQIQLQLPGQQTTAQAGKDTSIAPKDAKTVAKETSSINEKLLKINPKTVPHNAAPVSKAKTIIATDKVAATKSNVVKVNAANTKAKSPVKLNQSLPQAWAIRLATFGSERNATALVKHLRAQHLDIFTRTQKHGNNVYTQVFVGPMIHHQQVVALQQKLRQDFHLNGVITQYTP